MNESQLRALLHIVAEEHSANSGFTSPDSDLIFRQAFCDDWADGEQTTAGKLKELLTDCQNLGS